MKLMNVLTDQHQLIVKENRNMTPSNRDPLGFAHAFSQYVRAIVHILIWATIGLASAAGAYVALRATLVAVKIVLKALGI